MAEPRAGFTVNIQTPRIRIRDERGRYTSAIAQLFASSREQMERQQTEVVTRIRNNIQRDMVSTGRLLRVTADPKNVVATRTSEDQFTIGLGNIEWLDRGIAKYWRTIEEGSAATWKKRSFRSLELQGIWGPNLGEYRRVSNPWVGLGKGENRVTRARQEMYQPFRIGRGGKPSGLPVFHPGHDIRPMHAYRSVAQSPDFQRGGQRLMREFVQRILSTGFVHNPVSSDGGRFYPGL